MSVVMFVIGVMLTRLCSAHGQRAELYRCPKGLNGNMVAYREKCYRFVSTEKHWDQAQNDCQIKGGNLVQIHDQDTQNFVYTTAKSTLGWRVNGMWIGAHDQRITNKWEWVIGNPSTAGRSITWSNWGSGQPSCGLICVEHCGQMRFDDYGRWHDVQCHARFLFNEEKYRYCCMYDMGPRSTTTTTTTTTPSTTTVTTAPSSDPRTNATTESSSGAESTTASSSSSSSRQNTRDNNIVSVDSGSSTPIVAIVGAQGAEKRETRDGSVQGGTVAGIAIGCLVALCLLLLLLLVLIRRRKQKKEAESPSDNAQNMTYTGVLNAAGPSLAYVNPQAERAAYLNPVLTVRMPDKMDEKTENPYSECLDNEHNACAAAAEMSDDDLGYSKGVYEDIKLDMQSDLSDDSDDDFDKLKTKTPSVEYLHARNPPTSGNSGQPITVPPRNLYTEEREHADNIYVPMDTKDDDNSHYQ